ncbi:MAG: hypothetical protein GY953_48970, partial [bacterium]|nr:hypothetical protein [bacterium]
MTSNRKRLPAKIAAFTLPAFLLFAYEIGPDPRNTGAPGDQTCAQSQCHVGEINSGPGNVAINFPAGETYIPGMKQLWRITVTDPDASVYGFQATARPASDNQFGQAGSFAVTDPANMFILCEDAKERPVDGCIVAAPIEFIEHRIPIESNMFTFEWTPPAEDVGDVQVYIAANAANGDGFRRGDRIYTASYTLKPAAFTAAPVIRDTLPVLQAFDNTERLSSGTWIQVYGENFALSVEYARPWNTSDFD